MFTRDTERKQRHREREKQATPREPNVGLDPRTLGSHPEPKTDAHRLSQPGVPPGQLLRLLIPYFLKEVSKFSVVFEVDIVISGCIWVCFYFHIIFFWLSLFEFPAGSETL